MDYDCRIRGLELHCTITADRDLAAPLFRCAGMAPLKVVSGGEEKSALGSFIELRLPDLKAGEPHRLVLAYAGGYRPANRAWMPMGPSLKVGDDVIVLPPTQTGCLPPSLPDPGPFDGLPLLPQPQDWQPAGGTVACDGFACEDEAFGAVSALADRRSWHFRGAFPVRITEADLPEDGYDLTIAEDRIDLRAGDRGGRFYGAITLLLLLQSGPLPLGRIVDAPRFGWRGQHLDCARHFYEPATIRDLLDVMALLKLNRFHWHFADDEAFRLEIESCPDLWRQTALRGEGHLLPGLFSAEVEAGGTYSLADARDLIAHAAALNIEIMPEVEVPAHALALARIYPQTRDPDDTGTERSVQGYAANVVNPAMPATWDILTRIVTEVGALFPFGLLHLGCDELPEGTWLGSPAARALMAREGLQTTDDLQGWTMARLAAIVAANGQRPAAWEEAARGRNGGIGHDAILFSWTGQGPGLDAARAGHDVVMTPAQHVYLDMAQTDDPDDWGASWAAFVGLTDTVAWDPVPDPALSDRIIGVQGCFWSEFTSADVQLWPMLLPRIFGVAAMGWQASPPAPDDLIQLARAHPLMRTALT